MQLFLSIWLLLIRKTQTVNGAISVAIYTNSNEYGIWICATLRTEQIALIMKAIVVALNIVVTLLNMVSVFSFSLTSMLWTRLSECSSLKFFHYDIRFVEQYVQVDASNKQSKAHRHYTQFMNVSTCCFIIACTIIMMKTADSTIMKMLNALSNRLSFWLVMKQYKYEMKIMIQEWAKIARNSGIFIMFSYSIPTHPYSNGSPIIMVPLLNIQ